LAEYIAGSLPSTFSTSSVIPQHRLPSALPGEVRFIPFTCLRFLKFFNSYYVRSRFFDHVNTDRFDRRHTWLFHPLCFFPRSFLNPRAFGLGSGNGSLRRFSSGGLCRRACLTAHCHWVSLLSF